MARAGGTGDRDAGVSAIAPTPAFASARTRAGAAAIAIGATVSRSETAETPIGDGLLFRREHRVEVLHRRRCGFQFALPLLHDLRSLSKQFRSGGGGSRVTQLGEPRFPVLFPLDGVVD